MPLMLFRRISRTVPYVKKFSGSTRRRNKTSLAAYRVPHNFPSSDLECGSPAAAFLIDPHDSIFGEAQEYAQNMHDILHHRSTVAWIQKRLAAPPASRSFSHLENLGQLPVAATMPTAMGASTTAVESTTTTAVEPAAATSASAAEPTASAAATTPPPTAADPPTANAASAAAVEPATATAASAAEPTASAVKPTATAVKPTTAAVEPTAPAAVPPTAAVEPTAPAVDPAAPAVEPAAPAV